MKTYSIKLLLAGMFLGLAAGPVCGQGVVVVQHSGYNNPVNEGFSFGASGQVGGVTNDLGYNAWATLLSSSAVTYSSNVGDLTGLDWILSVTVRVTTSNVGGAFDAIVWTGTQAFELNFGSDSSGNQMVFPTLDAEYTVNGSAYNNYQLVYDASANTASFWINGTEELTGIAGVAPNTSVAHVSWGGAYQSPSDYQANWSLVSLEIVPEPSTLSFLFFGGGVLFYVRCKKYKRLGSLQ
jgi:PEP-CTERM motif